MSKRQFTKEQGYAITARGGSILVSAAAGSGKTTVLVERIMSLITESGIDADRLLVCTFTRDATAEMKHRLNTELSARIAACPGDRRLRRQKLLLQKANITTIHSFCLNCMREYFSSADTAPDFRVADDSELSLLRSEVIADVIDKCYESGDETVHRLMDMVSYSSGETYIGTVIMKIDEFISAFPDPEEKLAELSSVYDCAVSPELTPWGEFILSYCRDCISYLLRLNGRMISDAEQNPVLCDVFPAAYEKDRDMLSELYELADKRNWAELREALRSVNFMRMPGSPADAPGKAEFAEQRKYIKDQLGRLSGFVRVTAEEFAEDSAAIAPEIKALCSLVLNFRGTLSEKKRERKIMDYDDLEHRAAKLLFEKREDKYYRTQTAHELSRRFDEILIDEYQDTNYTQDLIFRAVGRTDCDEYDDDIVGEVSNMFMVGDIKQSIYGFRKAVPKLFLERLERYSAYDPGAPVFPAKIILGQNFRSRREVTDTVNYVYSQLMTPAMGGIDYNDGQQLFCSGSFPDAYEPGNFDMNAELHLLTKPDVSDSERNDGDDTGFEDIDSRDSFEAAYCAGLIKRMIREGFKVTGSDGQGGKAMRPARFGDFCIMRRSISGDHGTAFYEKLSEAGIPVRLGADSGFFSAPEIRVMLSLLRAVNNPLLDIPLTAALRSPIFGFDCDKLAQICAGSGDRSVYACLRSAAYKGDELCARTLDSLSSLRDMASTLPADRLILHILRSTGFMSAVQVTSDGDIRKGNLIRLLEYARSFESCGFRGLSRFIRNIDRIAETGKELAGAERVASDNCVTVRTMHGAKGLEFPICIITGLGSSQNSSSKTDNVVLSGTYGIGINSYDEELRVTRGNVQRSAVSLSRFKEETDEELRVLYVSMTRASDKLIMIASGKGNSKLESRLSAASKLVFRDGIDPVAAGISPSPEKWLTACALRLPECDGLRRLAGLDESVALPSGTPFRVMIPEPEEIVSLINIKDTDSPARGGAAMTVESIRALSVSPGLLEKITGRLDYKYPYDQLRYVPAKVTASGAVEHFDGRISAARPAFIEDEGLTAAQKGTAMHRLLQYCDLAALRNDAPKEISRLTEAGGISKREADCIDISAVKRYFDEVSPLIDGAGQILREWQFSVALDERLLSYYTEYSSMGECVVLEGQCDMLLLTDKNAVIIDYKTDRMSSAEQLAERYLPQLTLYASAVKQSFNVDRISCMLYSFAQNRLIGVELKEDIF